MVSLRNNLADLVLDAGAVLSDSEASRHYVHRVFEELVLVVASLFQSASHPVQTHGTELPTTKVGTAAIFPKSTVLASGAPLRIFPISGVRVMMPV